MASLVVIAQSANNAATQQWGYNDLKKLATNLHNFSKPGAYYLAYVAEAGHDIELNLPGSKNYTVEG